MSAAPPPSDGGEPDRTIPSHGLPGGGSPQQPLSAGSAAPRIPGVTLGREIARGGMGVVYRGEQQYLARTVAVKVLANYLDGAEFVQRFQREARILAGISHPHIVTCHDAGTTDDGRCYMVMEYVDGPTLRVRCDQNGPLAVPIVLRVLRDVALALQHAHEAGIIHRDVKPENVLLQHDERRGDGFPFVPKLVDLGLARQAQADSQMTAPGVVMGTTSTMAPEQFNDPDHVDFRADIYGLGCLAYHALCGVPAFAGGNLTATITAKCERFGPDPRQRNARIPAEVAELVRSMMANAPADRPQSYATIIDTCVRLLGSAGATAPPRAMAPVGPAGADGARRGGLLAPILLAMAVGGLGAFAALKMPIGNAAPPPPVVHGPDETRDPGPPPPDPQPIVPQPTPTPDGALHPDPNDGTDGATNGDGAAPAAPFVASDSVAMFATDLPAAGWTIAKPEGMSVTPFVFDDGTLTGNCPKGEATCSFALPAAFTVTGKVTLKQQGWGTVAADRTAGIRLVPQGQDPLVLWIEPAGPGHRANLDTAPAGSLPPRETDGVRESAHRRTMELPEGQIELFISRAQGELVVAFGVDIYPPDTKREGVARKLPTGACRLELFVRDGTAAFEDFQIAR